MGNRISKVTTKTGDGGTTTAADGTRYHKHSPIMNVIGDIDELNSAIGTVYCHNIGFGYDKYNVSETVEECLIEIQHKLFDIGGYISMRSGEVSEEDIQKLEQHLEKFNSELEPLAEFILPSGIYAATQCHLARAICRRAERNMWANNDQPTNNHIYLNRLSDLLFVLSRHINHTFHKKETMWKSKRLDSIKNRV